MNPVSLIGLALVVAAFVAAWRADVTNSSGYAITATVAVLVGVPLFAGGFIPAVRTALVWHW